MKKKDEINEIDIKLAIDLLVLKLELLTYEDFKRLTDYKFEYLVDTLIIICNQINKFGYKSTGKKLHSFTFDAYFNSIKAEYQCKYDIYALMGALNGDLNLITDEFTEIYTKGFNALEKLEELTKYPPEDLIVDILNQKQLVYLFSALSNEEIFTKSPELLSEALSSITAFSKNSIKKNFNLNSSSNGGMDEKEKNKIIEELKRIIEKF